LIMMNEYLIVDGYNMIGSWPELTRLKEVDFEAARDSLIFMLANYQAYSGIQAYLVFDAYYVPGKGGKYEVDKLKIIYTKEKETADELIERLVSELIGRRKQIYVATSDFAEQNVTFGKGALRISARELYDKIKQSQNELRKKLKSAVDFRRNTFDSNLSPEHKQLFEKWRRGQ